MAYWGTQRIRNLFLGSGGTPVQSSNFKTVVTNVTTAGDGSITAAAIVGGFITRDCTGGNRADTLATATQILAALDNPIVGTSFEFTIRNTSDAAETITVTTATGLTLSGTMTIAQNNSKRFLAVVTGTTTPAITIYSLGTIVH